MKASVRAHHRLLSWLSLVPSENKMPDNPKVCDWFTTSRLFCLAQDSCVGNTLVKDNKGSDGREAM